jgi:PST family polysaccharide transporter
VRWGFNRAVARELLMECWPFLVGALAIMVYMRIGHIMLRHLSSERELGYYTAAIPLYEAGNFIPTRTCLAFAAAIARKKQVSETAYLILLMNLFRSMLLAGVTLAAALYLARDVLVALVYGPQYHDAAEPLGILALALPFIFVGVVQLQWLVNERRSLLNLFKALSGAIVCVALNAVLIPTYGAVGAAWAAVAAQVTSAVAINLVLAPGIFRMQLGFRPTSLAAR